MKNFLEKPTTILFSIVLFFLSTNCNCQESIRFTEVKNQTTLVILDDDTASDFSRSLKYAIKKYWTITKYQFITKKEHETKYEGDLNYTFIGLVKNGEPIKQFGSNGGDWYHMNLNFFRYVKWVHGPDYSPIAGPPSGFYASSANLNFRGKTTATSFFMTDINTTVFLVRYLQNCARGISGYTFYKKGYGPENNKILHKKTLLLCKEDIDPEIVDLNDLKTVYPFNVKFVSKGELFSYLDKSDSTVAIAICGAQQKPSDYVSLLIVDGSNMRCVVDLFKSQRFFTRKEFKKIATE